MDGDGLSVPVKWLKLVLSHLNSSFKEYMDLDHDPKIFVLTVLGTQSTGKSTLLNTMFGLHFPVSAGRCTKGAFLQLIPLNIKECQYDAIFVIDTEGLCAPEYKHDAKHDNEIATFVLGISDLAIINVMGALPTDIENFLQVSLYALMRMSEIEFNTSIMFVHHNCDPSAKDKNIESRGKFMEIMDSAVVTTAKLDQKGSLFTCFQDVVDISLQDDFIYFPPFLEGAAPMAPPSGEYSSACGALRDYIVSKMIKATENKVAASTIKGFTDKLGNVWNGVLTEQFVLSLINSAEIQIKYEIEKKLSTWKNELENEINNKVDESSRGIKALFKKISQLESNKDTFKHEFTELETNLRIESYALNEQLNVNFKQFITNRTVNVTLYKKWEQKSIDRMEEARSYFTEACVERLKKCYAHEVATLKWKMELSQSKGEVEINARDAANALLEKKQSLSDEECEIEFTKFWSIMKARVVNKTIDDQGYKSANVSLTFKQVIYTKYGKASNFKKHSDMFGSLIDNEFMIEWMTPSQVEFHGILKKCTKYIHAPASWKSSVEGLIAEAIFEIERDVLSLSDVGGYQQMKFQKSGSIFDCRTLANEYIMKAIDILVAVHKKTDTIYFNLTDQFKTIFAFYAAQKAKSSFDTVQNTFLKFNDIATKIDLERDAVRRLFISILKKESERTIAANQVTTLLHSVLKNVAFSSIRIAVKDILKSISLKVHVHGLVVLDVIDAVSHNITEENVAFLKGYFDNPFKSFETKISEVIDNSPNIDILSTLKMKFNTELREIKEWLTKLEVSNDNDIVTLICQDEYIKKLGIGERDFVHIKLPELNAPKRIEVESEIISKVLTLISNTDKINVTVSKLEETKIKEILMSDVRDHLFQCKVKCPFCRAPCNNTHPERLGQHSCKCHRPKGFAGFTTDSDVFVTTFCNESVRSSYKFNYIDTKDKWVAYKDYKLVGTRYSSWDIDGIDSDHYKYWKYITYKIIPNLEKFFPAKKPPVKSWSKVSKSEAVSETKSSFHIDGKVRYANGKYII